jgi:hypothetical protein
LTWDDECETRVEEGGLLWVIQQRLAAHDMSRYCLDKRVPVEDDDPDVDEVGVDGPDLQACDVQGALRGSVCR